MSRHTAERRDAERERYATDPAYAEKKRQRSREYSRRNAERNRQRVAEWQKANPDRVAETSRANYIKRRDVERNSRLKMKYGITQAQYDAMFLEQRGLCAVCRQHETTARWSSLCVDHCHETGKVRGLLCNRCNRAIGLMRDSGDLLQTAAAYINHHSRG